jgi:hypothetical protein
VLSQEVEEGAGIHAVEAQKQHVHPDVQMEHEHIWGVGCTAKDNSKFCDLLNWTSSLSDVVGGRLWLSSSSSSSSPP